MGNPPYQENGTKGKAKHGKIQLYTKFIKYSLDNSINKNGYLLFITPQSWSTPSSPIFKQMTKDNMLYYLNVENRLKQYFKNVGSTFSYFIVKCCSPKERKTVIVDENGARILLSLDEFSFLPRVINKITLMLNKKMLSNICNEFIRKDTLALNDLSDEATKKYKYPQQVKHNFIMYSKLKHETQGINKVLLFRSGYIRPMNTKNGVGENIMYKVTSNKTEAKNIVSAFNTKAINVVLSINKFSGYNNQQIVNMIYNDNFKDAKFDPVIFYKLAVEEINFINNYKC
jgi:hypothetical protein